MRASGRAVSRTLNTRQSYDGSRLERTEMGLERPEM
jgi:hypothetical protein